MPDKQIRILPVFNKKPPLGEFNLILREKRMGEGYLEKCHDHPIQDATINLTAYSPADYLTAGPNFFGHFLPSIRNPIFGRENLPFEITETETRKIYDDILNILRDPEKVGKHLKSLDNQIAEELRKQEGVEPYSDTDFPEFLIPARTYFIPGPPPEHYKPRNHARLLDRILLEREQADGINLNTNSAPKFAGLVKPHIANAFVKKGHVFAEDVQIDNLLLHGKNTHRLAFEVIRSAVKSGDLKLEAGGKTLDNGQLLNLLITARNGGLSLWDSLIDINTDAVNTVIHNQSVVERLMQNNAEKRNTRHYNAYLPQNFSFSARGPYHFNSLILCFGQDIGLPNLQHVALNSHWKEAAQMTWRANLSIQPTKTKITEAEKAENEKSFFAKLFKPKNPLLNISVKQMDELDTSFPNLYTHCMKALCTIGTFNPGLVGPRFFSTLPQSADKTNKYEEFEEGSGGIKRKIVTPKEAGMYESWEDYITKKFAQIKREKKVVPPTIEAPKTTVAPKGLLELFKKFRPQQVHPSTTTTNAQLVNLQPQGEASRQNSGDGGSR